MNHLSNRITLGGVASLCQALVCLPLLFGLALVDAHGAGDRQYDEVAAGVFVSSGEHLALDANSVGHIANSGFIIGGEAVAVIDPGGNEQQTSRLIAAIAARTDLPVKFVILTHLHPDHMLGVGQINTPAVTVIAHERFEQTLPQRLPVYLNRFGQRYAGTGVALSDMLPDVVVAQGDVYRVDLGGRTLELRAHPVAHSDTDLSVLDTATRVLWAGDLVFRARTPSLDGSLPGWLSVLAELDALQADIVIPGHGDSGSWRDTTADQNRYLQTLLERTREDISSGRGLAELLSTAETESSADWLLFSVHHPINVSKAYTELEWE